MSIYKNLTIENMQTSSGGVAIDQEIVRSKRSGNVSFYSYKTEIVRINKEGVVILDKKYWDYSKTTSKYRNMFLGEDTKTIKKKIADGTYKLRSLN